MASYKLVDVEQLEADMTDVANTIRGSGGATGQLEWPDGFKSAISDLTASAGLSSAFITGSIQEVNDSSVYSIRAYGLAYCSQLTSVVLSAALSIGMGAFQYCTALTTVDLPAASVMASQVFVGCSKLSALILRKESAICTLSSVDAFYGSSGIILGTGYIYVPAALVDTYKADSVWSTYAAQFRALEDYTVDGTTTGALDATKI